MGELNIHNLNNYIIPFNLTVFVETGSGKGEGIKHALNYSFKKLYSIEIVPQLYEHCKTTITDPRVKFLNQCSVDGIENSILEEENENILFWLDAHFPGADFHFNSYDHLSEHKKLHKPLEAEFNTIWAKRSNKKDVFIIDDLRIYEDGPFELGQWELKYKYGESNINFILDKVKDTHNITRDYRHQGFLILTPK
jgi:hypothetical protein